jgi:hypothetical protein
LQGAAGQLPGLAEVDHLDSAGTGKLTADS